MSKKKQRPVLEALEPRVLYSADPFGVVFDLPAIDATDGNTTPLSDSFERQPTPHSDSPTPSDEHNVDPSELSTTPATPRNEARLELVFVDTGTADYQQLLDDLLSQSDEARSFEVIVIDAHANGINTISESLIGYRDIDAVHIISHGSNGALKLGSATLDAQYLKLQANEISQWAKVFSESGDILFYGCDLASDNSGKALIESIAALTKTDIAASDNLTGHASLGGDWDLEYRSGTVDSTVAVSYEFQNQWSATLAIYTVANTNDSGAGSLRQAIINANANTGSDTIKFGIAGGGTQVINLATALNVITEQVTIDGTTQTGWSEGNFLPVVIDGNGGGFDALTFSATSDGSEVRGLVVRDFDSDTIDILAGADNITIAGSFIGQFNSDGTDAGDGEANTFSGVRVNSDDVTIGGSSAADQNLISGNEFGVLIRGTADNTTIAGNYFGTDVTGSVTIGSDNDYGVYIYEAASGSTIGGATSAEGNVFAGININSVALFNEANDNITIQSNSMGVSADGLTLLDHNDGTGSALYIANGGDNTQIQGNMIAGARYAGIELDVAGTSDATVIQGNTIGTDASGTKNWGLGENGILIENASNTVIGGIGAGQENVIAFSGQVSAEYGSAISIQDGGSGNSIRGNSIYANKDIGIDLSAGTVVDGLTPNDAGDADSGSNNLQNWAVLTSASIDDAANLAYTLDTTSLAPGSYSVDFYASTDREGGVVEGKRYLGTLTSVADGNSELAGTLGGVTLALDEYVTLVTTDAGANSSEFSNYAVAFDGDAGGTTPSDLLTSQSSNASLSLNRDGGNDAYLVADTSPFGGQSAISVEVQFSINSPATGLTPLISYADGNNEDELFIGIDSSGQVFFRTSANGSAGYGSVASAPQLFDGERHSVAVTWENTGGILMFYVDGEQLGLGRNDYQKTTTIDTGGTLVFGQHQTSPGAYDSNDVFSGTLYDVRIFNDVRTAGEIQSSYASNLPWDEDALMANWSFDELSSDGVVTDSVIGNKLVIDHIMQSGFTTSVAKLKFVVDENAINGAIVGAVSGKDAEREAQIATLLAGNANLHYNAETGKFYEYVNTGKNWTTALADAQTTTLSGVSGNLVTVNSAVENQIVVDLLNANGGTQAYIAASDSGVEGEWRWYDSGTAEQKFYQGDGGGYNVDGAYTHWDATNPNNSGGQHYAKIFASNGLWDDVDGSATQKSVIEYDADAVLDTTHALTYAITSQPETGAFAIDASTGQITVADSSKLDFETRTSHTLSIEVTDGDGNTRAKDFVVSLNDLAESNNTPTDLSSGIELNTDGGNDAYLIANNGGAILGGLSKVTFETTFLTNGLEDTPSLISYATSTEDNEFAIYTGVSTGDLFMVIGGDSVNTGYAFDNLDIDSLHTLAASWDASSGSWALYTDGDQVANGTGLSVGYNIESGGTLVLGNEQDSQAGDFSLSQELAGALYDVRIWDEVRSETEIALNHQHKFDSGSLPSGLVANWQMDGFNGSNQIVDVVSGNNLSIAHATGTGFIASIPVRDLHINENSSNGSTVGYVVPSDPDIHNDIATDGLFLESGIPGTWQTYTSPATFGDWQVVQNSVELLGDSYERTLLGGLSIDMNGTAPGAIEQVLATEVGREYQVTFALSGEWTGGEAVKDLRVSANGTSADFSITEPNGWSRTNMLWENRTLTFVADSTSTTLRLESLEGISLWGPVIGDVQVVEIPTAISTILSNDSTLTYDAGTGKFYRFVDTPADWTTASSNAQSAELNGLTGQLVTINSAYENQIIYGFAQASGKNIYLGASDATTEGDWYWLNGDNNEQLFWQGDFSGTSQNGQYYNWRSVAPNGGATDDVARLRTDDGYWTDRDGTSASAYVIEWDASKVLSNHTLSMTDDASGRFTVDSNSGEITVADGSLLDFETATSHNVTIEVTDAAGNSYSETTAIAVDNRGGEPTQSLPVSQTTLEDTPRVFSVANGNAITVSDTDAGTDMRLQVYISTNFNGTLTLPQTTGLSILGGSNGSTFMTIQGTESDLNAAFDGMTFTPASGYTGPVTLDMTTSLGADLVGHYEFEGNANDSSVGLAQHGTFFGDAVAVTDAVRGEVLSLDGTGDYVEVSGLFSNPASVTASAWVNANSDHTDLISMGNDFILRIDDANVGGFVNAIYWDGSGFKHTTSNVSIKGTGWHHLAMTFDDTTKTMTLYIDGIQAAQNTFSNSITYQGSDTRIGNGPYTLAGLVDDARIYTRALSADEIVALASEQMSVVGNVAITVSSINDTPTITTAIQINNHSFEAEVLPGDGSISPTIADWTKTGTHTGTWNVTPALYASEAPDGFNAGYIDNGGTISQTTSVVFSADTGYELIVAVGDQIGGGDPSGWEVRLYAGAQLLGSSSTAESNPADGTFADVTLSLNANQLSAFSAAYGNTIRVELFDDGSSDNLQFDNVRLTQTSATVSTRPVGFVEDGSAVVLDGSITLNDAELTAIDNFNGATLTLARNGGAHGDDTFSESGLLAALTESGNLTYNGTTIGAVTTNSTGTLLLTFNSNASHDLVNSTLQSISYSNSNQDPSANVQIDWVFDDGNAGSQGSGGALSATGSTTITFTAVNDDAVAVNDSGSTPEDTALVINLTANDLDPDSNPIHVLDVSNPANGSLLNNNDGTVTYTSDTNYNGADSFTYVVSDYENLSSHWRLDGDAVDSVGSDGGTVVGATTVEGAKGDALSFDEVNDHVVIPDFTIGNEFSLSFQLKIDDNSGSLFQYIVSHGDVNNANSLNIFLNEDTHGTDPNKLRTVIRDTNDVLNNTALEFDASSIIGDGLWHTYTLTIETGVGAKVYLDSVLQNSDTGGGDAFDPTTDLFLGARQDLDANRRFGGSLDSVLLFDKALSASEVSDVHSGGSAQGTVNITVNAFNDVPVATGNTIVASEDVALVISPSDFSFADIESDALTSVTITGLALNGGTLTHSAGAVTVTNGMTVNTAQLADLTFTSALNSSTDSSFTYTVNDTGSGIASAVMNITVNARNDDPSNVGSLPADISVTEDVSSNVDLSAITLSDIDHAGGSLTLTLTTSTGGDLSATNGGGVTVVDSGSGALSLSGTLADLNTFLNTASNVQYLHGTSNTFGDDADTISVVINDGGNTGSGGGTDQNLGTVNVDITATNDTPTLGNNSLTLLEGETVTINAAFLNATDLDSSDLGLTFTVSNVSGGHFAWSVSPQTLISSFNQAQVTASQVVFVHNGGETASAYDVAVSDSNTSTVASAAVIAFTNINDAPMLAALGGDTQTVPNDGTVALVDTGALATLIDADLPVNYNGATLVVTGNSFNSLDVLGMSTAGSISLSAGVSNGSVLSVGGTGVSTLSTTSSNGMTLTFNANAALADIEAILRAMTFESTSLTLGSRSIDFVFNDGDGTANGGSDTSLTTTVNIALSSANDGLVTSDEDTTHIFSAGDFDFTGVTGGNLDKVTITTLPSDGTLTLSGSLVTLNQEITKAQIDAGLLRFAPAADANGLLYASFDFFVNSGKDSVTILAGEPNSFTLNGGSLPDTDTIIADSNHFGPGGTVSTNISVTTTSTTIDATYLSQGSVFFNGFVPNANWTAGEVTALDSWVQAGGILISNSDAVGYDQVSAFYGLSIGGTASPTWHVGDPTHAIMNGPFGLVGGSGDPFTAAGSISYFDSASLAGGDQVIAVDSVSGEPTMVLRQIGSGHILFTSDEGIFRANMTGGGSISTANDILAANIFAWAADQVSGVTTHLMNIDVTAVNDDPSNIGGLPTDLNVTEDVSSNIDLSSINLSDVDHSGGNLTLTLTTSTGGNLSATTAGGVTVGGSASGVLTLTGTQANLNTFLDTASNFQYLHGTTHTAGNDVDTINVVINDNGNTGTGGGTDQDLGTVNVDITAVNDVPVASGNTVIASEDVPLVIGAGDFSFTDVESDALASVTITGLTLNGGTLTHSAGAVTVTNGMTVTAAQLADLTFTSASNDSTNSSFTYTVNDANAGVTSAVMNITVNAVNDVPVASGNTVVASEDVPLVIAAGDFSFTDVESDSLASVTITGLTLNGGTLTHSAGAVNVTNGMTVTAAQLADLTFTSASNDSTNSSFTYTVNDADAGVTSAVMNITVNAVNDVPVATGNTVVASEDVPLVIGAGDFSFTDVESDALASVTIIGLSLNGGTLTHSAGAVNVTNGMTVTAAQLADLTFTSASNDSSDSSFTYTVNDTGTGVSSAVMNITVNAVNDVPVATGNTVVASEDVPLVIGAGDFSFTDVESDSLASVTITGLTLNGGTLTHSAGAVTVTNGMTVSAAQLADLTFTSASNDSTNSSFTYTVNDAGAGVASATMNITVNPVNDVPVATGNTVVANEDVPLVIGAGDFSFTDVEGDALASVTITGLTLNGGTLTHSAGAVTVTNGMTVTAAELADLTFTSASNDFTDSSFTYTVNDADAGVTSAVMNITVNAVNDVPVATGNTVVASEDVPLVIGSSDFSFTDGESDSLVSVTITGLTLNGGTLTHSAGAVNVTDGMTITAAQLADLTFTSALNDSTDSSFTYTVNDAGNGVSSAVMNITVNAVNDVPVATGNTVVASEDVPLVIGPTDFNFTDVEGDTLASVTVTGLTLNGGTLTHSAGAVIVTNGMTVTAAQLADLTFTSALNDTTDSNFTYTVNDADAGVTSAVMNITVNAVNDVPVATGNTVVASEDVPLVIAAGDFSYTDVESDSLVSVTITGLTLNSGSLTHSAGSVTVSNGMTVTAAQLADLTFTSALNDFTNSSFTYTVNDAGAGVTAAVMNITVNTINDVPVATGNTVLAIEDVPLPIDAGEFLYTDIESDALQSVTITGLNLNGGTLTHSAGAVTVTNGMTVTAAQLVDLTFNPALNSSLPVSFDYRVNDADNGVIAATMHITGIPVNDAPVIVSNGGGDNAAVQTVENYDQVLTVVATDVDIGDTIAYGIDGGSDAGLFSIDSNTGKLHFANAPNFEAPQDANQDNLYKVEVTASDGNGGVDRQALSITVLNENESPADLSLSNERIDAYIDTVGGFMIGQLSAADEDFGDTLSFSLVGGADVALFSLAGADAGTLMIDDGVINNNKQSAYELVVRATDAEGASVDRAFNITVTPREIITLPITEGPKNPPVVTPVVDPFEESTESILVYEEVEHLETDTPKEKSSHQPSSVDIRLESMAIDELVRVASELNTPNNQEPAFSTDQESMIALKHLDLANLNLMPLADLNIPATGALSVFENESFTEALQRMSRDMESAFEEEEKQHRLIAEISSGVTLSLTAGFISWMLQSGSLLASLLSAAPVWKKIDPLLILAASKRKPEEVPEETEEEKRVAAMFD